MEETIAKYEEELQELEKSRKEILRKAKEDAEKLIQESNELHGFPICNWNKACIKCLSYNMAPLTTPS